MKGSEVQKWFALEITGEPEATEAIEHALNELNALGTEINLMPHKPDDTVTVIGYFDSLPEEDALRDELHYALRIYDLNEDAIRTVERHEIEDQDWLHEWKKHWKPTAIGRFIIAPPWEDVVDDHKIVIRIEPNMAFGTGTHETTQLCLKAIEENYKPGQSFLDVGTGTGILAIAVAKLNARAAESEKKLLIAESVVRSSATSAFSALKISAYDTDVDSIKIALENADVNGVGDVIDFRVGPITSETRAFDFVCANLTLDDILPILDLLLEKTQATLVLSGILEEQEKAIVNALTEVGIREFSIDPVGEWIALTMQRTTEND